ncbi:SCO1664 family protein [Pelolinea submarina]|uniref:Putative repeat protein (TIGR03843 family) n=1 Tax=Pelolinea submarina TaxID=913107 RepID=A0A347ZND2_9CHLR|nr:SCO1664 family protein [Pelolinea submarina]REG08415.1 putative repeat protein (TIGR03843 family) [Pelolinea submarina]BBB46813.1 hypothetical protein Pelsub_P0040 [Pelolinea submarina]
MNARPKKTIPSKTEILEILREGKADLKGQFVLGSNYTFLVQLSHGGKSFQAVYKPQKGEMPLWDFPAESLAARESAAFLVSEALGWELVPPTIMRADGPLGSGSYQFFIVHDPQLHYFSFDDATRDRLRPTALFDLIINNADRKGGHILLDENDHLWLIDHGLCFHAQPKLRTVIWDFSGEPIENELLESLQNLLRDLQAKTEIQQQLSQLLQKNEIDALKSRIKFYIDHPVYPAPDENQRQFPWPLV